MVNRDMIKGAMDVRRPAWKKDADPMFYHLFAAVTPSRNGIRLSPRKDAIEVDLRLAQTAKSHGYGRPELRGFYLTVAIDPDGRMGYAVCSNNDTFEREEGRKRARKRLMRAMHQDLDICGPLNFFWQSPFRLVKDNLPELLPEEFYKFLENGNQRRLG